MYSQCYVQQSNGTYSPINVAPVGGIKCIQCQQISTPQSFQLHSKKHLNPKYANYSSVSSAKSPSKLNLKEIMNEEEEDTDMSVKSVLPDEIPERQKLRKKALQLLSKKEAVINNSINQRNLQAQEKITLTNNCRSNFKNGKESEQLFQNQTPLQLRQRIQFPIQSHNVQKKSIKLYENNKSNFTFRDKMKESSKIKNGVIDDAKQNLKAYEVVHIHSQETNHNIRQVFEIKNGLKKPKRYPNIMTKSKLSPTDNTNFENSEVKNTGDDATENPIRQWQCKSCHGFYCPTCKSTIPPKYRPVQNKIFKGEETEISEFYKTEYSKNCQSCH